MPSMRPHVSMIQRRSNLYFINNLRFLCLHYKTFLSWNTKLKKQVPDGPLSVGFRASQNWAYIRWTVHIYIRKRGWSSNSNTLAPDWPQRHGPAASVIAQQYSSTFVSLRFHSSQEKFGALSKMLLFFNFYKIAKVSNSEPSYGVKSGSVCSLPRRNSFVPDHTLFRRTVSHLNTN
jgi:hypothetical protein